MKVTELHIHMVLSIVLMVVMMVELFSLLLKPECVIYAMKKLQSN